MNFYPANLSVPNGDVTPSTPTHFVVGTARLGLVFGISCKALGLYTPRDSSWIGRTQVGRSFAVGLQTLVPSPFSPQGIVESDAPPMVRIYSSVATTRTYAVPIDATSGGATGSYRGVFTPGTGDSPAQYVALFAYAVEGSPKAQMSPFEVVGGGHPNGTANSTFSLDSPSGGTLICHQGSGDISRGLRPYLDQGD